jgi:hypothetical protein
MHACRTVILHVHSLVSLFRSPLHLDKQSIPAVHDYWLLRGKSFTKVPPLSMYPLHLHFVMSLCVSLTCSLSSSQAFTSGWLVIEYIPILSYRSKGLGNSPNSGVHSTCAFQLYHWRPGRKQLTAPDLQGCEGRHAKFKPLGLLYNR